MHRLNIRVWHFGPFSVFCLFVCLFVILVQSCIHCTWRPPSPTSWRQSVNRSGSHSWFGFVLFFFVFFFLHNYNWQVMKLFVKISALFFFFLRKDQNRAALKSYTQVLPCFTVWGLKMEKHLRVSYLSFFLLFCLLLLFFAAKKLRSFTPIHINST